MRVTLDEKWSGHLVHPSAKGRAVQDRGGRQRAGPRGAPVDTQSTGVGLANIQDRLTQAYGPGPWICDASERTWGFSVIIEIPLDTDQ